MHSKQKHPQGLWYLGACYSTVLFSYIGINSLLVLYMSTVGHLKTSNSYALYGAFNSLVFTLPLIGGYIADRLSYKPVGFVGMLLTAVACVVICIPHQIIFYYGIALYVIGYGFCTPALWTLVGLQYARDDERRDSGYTIFYLVFNFGSMFTTALSGYLSQWFGYNWAFIVDGVVGFAGVLFFFFVRHRVVAYELGSMQGSYHFKGVKSSLWTLLIGVLLAGVVTPLLLFPFANELLIWLLTVGGVLAIVWLARRQRHKVTRARLYAFIILCSISSFFWALYMLEGSLLIIFSAFNVNRYIGHWTIPPSVFYMLDPIGVILFGLLLGWLWHYLARHKKNPSLPAKFTGGLCSVGVGYLVFSFGAFVSGVHLVSAVWIILGYVFLTLAEILIAPIGMSMVGQLSPAKKEGVLMGVWTLFCGFGAILSEYLANLSVISKQGQAASVSNAIYFHDFGLFGAIAVLLSLLFIPVVSRIRRLTQ